MRVADAVAEAAELLGRAHVASPRVDAELLAAFVLRVPRGALAGLDDLSDGQLRYYRELTSRRAARVPLQHLTGTAPFRHLVLGVGRGVFVPRPETEVLVEWGLSWLQANPGAGGAGASASGAGAGALVVDLCSGSGAIAAAVATEAPGTRVFAVEQDPSALVWLRQNVDPYGVKVIEGDSTDPLVATDLDGTVDLVLCNPPYVPEVGAAGLPPEVTDHDPRAAVFGGVDGLDVIRPLIGRIATLLRPGGAFGIEHDDTHAYVVPTLVDADGRFGGVTLHHDLARRPRFTTATRVDSTAEVADLPP